MAKPTVSQLNQLEAELPIILRRLAAHAQRLMSSKRWVRGRIAPHGKEAGDLLQESIQKVLEGERDWPAGVPLEDTIVGAMQSISWSWATGLANREGDIENLRADGRLGSNDTRPASPDPEAECLSKNCFSKLRDRAMSETDGDPDAEKLVLAVLDGHERPQDVAVATGMTTTQISNAKKRLFRRMAGESVFEEAKS